MNPLAACAWRRQPQPERPDGALGRHGPGLGDWRETPMPSTRQEMGGWSGRWRCSNAGHVCERHGRRVPVACSQAMDGDVPE